MKTTTATDYQERILRALLYIQAHLDEPLELDALARAACFSPFHFHRVFRAMVGEPVHEHVRRLRLERAAVTLRQQPGRPVIEIALAAGYAPYTVLCVRLQSTKVVHLDRSLSRAAPT